MLTTILGFDTEELLALAQQGMWSIEKPTTIKIIVVG